MALLDLVRIPLPQSRVGPGINHQGMSARDGNTRRLHALARLRVSGRVVLLRRRRSPTPGQAQG
jgi:hypothetical protein